MESAATSSDSPRILRWLGGWMATNGSECAHAPTRGAAVAMLNLKIMRRRAMANGEPKTR